MTDFSFNGQGGTFIGVQLPWSPKIYNATDTFKIDSVTGSWLSVKFRNKVNAGDNWILLVDITVTKAPIGSLAVTGGFTVSGSYVDPNNVLKLNTRTKMFTAERGAGEDVPKPEWVFPWTGGSERKLVNFTPPYQSSSDIFTTPKNGSWFTVELVKQMQEGTTNWLVYADVKVDKGTPDGGEVSGTFNIVCKNSFGTFTSVTYTVKRLEGEGLEVLPIWLDEWVTIETDRDFIDYRIDCENEVVYQGRCYKAPKENAIEFNINKVCASYIENVDLVFINGETQEGEMWSKQFDIYDITDGAETLLKSLVFINDYSYAYRRVLSGNMTLNEPINNKLPYGAWIPFSFFNADPKPNSTVNINDAGGTTNTITVLNHNQYNVCKTMENNWYECLGVRYELSKDCADYVLYYANAYGGWDALAFYGKCQKSVDYQRYSYDKSFSNRLMTNYETNSYKTLFKTYYELNTGWLTDVQSDRIEHLVGSNRVYLHDMRTDEIKAVVVENADVQVQKFLFTGKANNYTITVRESQERIRQ